MKTTPAARCPRPWIGLAAVLLLPCSAALPAEARQGSPAPTPGVSKPRIIATTDGEIDDRCSMIRFLLYADQWQIEGLIYSSSRFHWKGHNWAGETWIEEDIDRYAQVYENLRRHSLEFPSPDELRSRVFVGNIAAEGEMQRDTPGSNRIVEVLLDNKPGPVYLQAWGGTNTIARALWQIQHQHPDQIKRVSQKAIIYIILDQDKTFRQYIQPNWPDIQVLGSFRQFGVIAYRWQKCIPAELHRFFDRPWMQQNILRDHGPLCAAYPSDHFLSEGDSPSFMHQIRTGLAGLEHPGWGGWGGRFECEPGTRNVWRGAKDDNDLYKPVWRWAEHFQNDWAARADWCIRPFGQANHAPRAVVGGRPGLVPIRLHADPGQTIELSAAGSSDPDGDKLVFRWWQYREAGTCPVAVPIDGADREQAVVRIPAQAAGSQIHVILTVRDHGEPNLFAYRRVVIDVASAGDP